MLREVYNLLFHLMLLFIEFVFAQLNNDNFLLVSIKSIKLTPMNIMWKPDVVVLIHLRFYSNLFIIYSFIIQLLAQFIILVSE